MGANSAKGKLYCSAASRIRNAHINLDSAHGSRWKCPPVNRLPTPSFKLLVPTLMPDYCPCLDKSVYLFIASQSRGDFERIKLLTINSTQLNQFFRSSLAVYCEAGGGSDELPLFLRVLKYDFPTCSAYSSRYDFRILIYFFSTLFRRNYILHFGSL